MRLVKIPTTRAQSERRRASRGGAHGSEWGIPPDEIARFVHGTTVATNAVLERKGAKIGLITTAGFRDVLEIGRQSRRNVYSVMLEPETPGVPRAGRAAPGSAGAHHGRRAKCWCRSTRAAVRQAGDVAGRRGRAGDRDLVSCFRS